MFLRSRAFRLLFALSLVAVMSAAAFADTVRLKNGGIIKGKIVNFTGGRFSIVIGEGTRRREMTFNVGEIESIEFDTPTATRTVASRNTTPPPRQQTAQRPVQQPRVVPQTRPTPAPVVRQDDSDVAVVEEDDEPIVAKGRPDPVTPTVKTNAITKPVELNVKVLADETANGWTNSGWVVRKGQRIRISGDGSVSLGQGRTSTPSGLGEVEDAQKLVKHAATGALIAVIGDDNNEFIYVGSEREFTASRDGALFLGVNEGNLKDNSGSYTVKIEILPGEGE